jgi:hypothetical protein
MWRRGGSAGSSEQDKRRLPRRPPHSAALSARTVARRSREDGSATGECNAPP